ncbi:acyl-CoA carboxylase subunit epsilon [Cumulibacter manganitolerans]|uniref:acyl-CoA carboxylase subunit epsilon n=1 Tax=Cumulibacter manganitolerans TaxID=1884992 RepID=UPI001E56256A|nr:acyl-CoA carboxylase subunit epsilon [Cumulibacter manganitolerans]
MSEQKPADPDAPADTSRSSSERGTSDVETPHADDATAPPTPFFTIEAGNPTPEEIAVLTLVLAAAASGGEKAPAPKPVSGWASPARRMRSIGRPGFGGWRAEYQPR